MRQLRILLADDHPQALDFLQVLFDPDYDVVGAVEDGETLVTIAQILKPDIVITDINRPRLDGIEAARQLRTTVPDCDVIIHSSHQEPEIMAEAYAAGVSVYLVKGGSPSIASAIRAVIGHPRRTGIWNMAPASSVLLQRQADVALLERK